MKPDSLEMLWHSAPNQPNPSAMETHRAAFAVALARRRSRFTVAMSVVSAVLATLTVAFLRALLLASPTDRVGGWVLVILLAFPWVAFVLFVRRHLRLRDEHPDYSGSIADAIGSAMAENRFAQARLRTIALLHAASLPLLGFGVHQLWAAGKATTDEATSLAAVLAVFLVVTGGGLAYRYFALLRPRDKALEKLLASYL